jgi:uncharacterized protein (TIGR03000 family)
MYSVVLMMAMTTGGDVADCHRHGGCTGGGCSGYVAESCGCSGGGRHRLLGGGGLLGGHRHGGGGCGCTGYVAPACGCTGYVAPTGGCTGGAPVHPGEDLKKMPKEEKTPKTGMAPAPATLIVSLPADAKLVIDDTLTSSTSSERTFVSPNLTPGSDYNYTLKADVVRNGQTVHVEEKVTVRAGEETRVSLLPTTVAAR